MEEGDIGLRADQQNEWECAADVGEDEGVRHRAHDIASDVEPRGDKSLKFCLRRELLHLVLCGGDGDGDIHDGAERAEDDARKEQLAKVDILQIERLEHARLLLGDACKVGKMYGEQCEEGGDENAADRSDDRARRFDVASVDDKLRRECDDRADEERPEENVGRGKQDEGDESLCDEKNGKDKREQCLDAGHTAEENQQRGKANEQEEHGGQSIIVDDGVAAVLCTHNDVFPLCGMNVKGGVVQRAMCDRCFRACRLARVDADAYVVLHRAWGKRCDLVWHLRSTQNLRLVCRRIAVLTGGKVKEEEEQGRNAQADSEKTREALRMNLHESTPFVEG